MPHITSYRRLRRCFEVLSLIIALIWENQSVWGYSFSISFNQYHYRRDWNDHSVSHGPAQAHVPSSRLSSQNQIKPSDPMASIPMRGEQMMPFQELTESDIERSRQVPPKGLYLQIIMSLS
jgi:hypothetical protein